MTILVTGASGQLGRLVLDALLDRGVEPSELRAGARTPDALASYADRGVDVVRLDYDDQTSIDRAVEGADKVLLISGNEFGQRVAQHGAVIDAAAKASVAHLVYTSAPHAREVDFVLAPEHAATEELIEAAGVPATVLRNNWYHENYAGDVAGAAATGAIVTSAGEGRVPSAARADYAEAAAVVLTATGYEGQVLELGGDVAWDFETLAATVGEVLGRDVELRRVDTAEHAAHLEQVGLDPVTVHVVTGIDAGIRAGVLGESDGTLARLLGRPTTPLVEGLRTLV